MVNDQEDHIREN
jgi:hypothetical protein